MTSFVLLSICFYPRRGESIVGQVGNLRPIVNRPAGSAYRSQGSPARIAANPVLDSK